MKKLMLFFAVATAVSFASCNKKQAAVECGGTDSVEVAIDSVAVEAADSAAVEVADSVEVVADSVEVAAE